MPIKKKERQHEEQRQRFEAEVDRMIAAGELDPIDADEKLDRLSRGPIAEVARKKG